MKFTVPVKTRNPLNGSQGGTRGAVLAKAARRKKERQAAWAACAEQVAYIPLGKFEPPYTVTLTRVSAGTLDTDGLQAALKSVRDGVADVLASGDGAAGPRWEYAQRKCKRGEFGVEVEIT